MTPHILYLVHDLSDPAVRRRVLMLKLGGAHVTVAGFRRTAEPAGDIDGMRPIDLGSTHDGRFAQRLAAVARAAVQIRAKLRHIPRPDVIVARNLEMLALASRARSQFGDIPVVYECLDIHRLMLRGDIVGRAMRGAERHLLRRVQLVLTSSPAFVRDYFAAYDQTDAAIQLVENKFFEPVATPAAERASAPSEGPWRIGWFGALRCSRSLEMLADFSRRSAEQFEIVLRGRPALSEFADFHGFVARQPSLAFHGPYRNPEDVEAIYGEVHFAWLIDFFEDGLNSKWLLPNRLYEGCRFGAVPIALEGTETAAFLKARNIGLILPEPSAAALERLLGGMDAGRFTTLRQAVLAQGRSTFACDREDCRRLVDRLGRLAATPRAHLAEAAA